MLTILLPSATAVLQITDVTLTGKDGVKNIIVEGGDVISLQAKINDAVQPDKVLFVFNNIAHPFTACSQVEGGTLCTYNTEQLILVQGKYPYSVSVVEGISPSHTVNKEFYVDGAVPVITKFIIEKTNEVFNLNYAATDTACPNCPGQCAGFSTVSLVEGSSIKKSFDVVETLCAIDRTVEIPISDLQLEEGNHELCLVVSDKVGHESEKSCKNLTIDTNHPEFLQDTLKLIVGDKTLNYVADKATTAEIRINLTDFSLDIDKVYGDFSGLNSVNPAEQRWRKGECRKAEDEYYSCSFKNIILNKPRENPSILFNATDMHGNTQSKNIVLLLQIDQSPPQVLRVYSIPEAKELGTLYVKAQNLIYADISESGSGFKSNNVYLQLRDFGNKIQAKNCTQTNGDIWTCVFDVGIAAGAQTQGITDFYGTQDDSGNPVQGGSVTVIVDNTVPVINEVEKNYECPTAEQTLTLKFTVKDASPLFVSTNAQRISNHRGSVEGECVLSTKFREMFDCTLSVDDLSTGFVDDKLSLVVKDAAGNTATKDVHVKVCAIEADRTPEFITMSYGSAPKIDKRTLSFIPIPIYIPLSLTLKGGAEVIDGRAVCSYSNEAYFVNSFNTLVIKLSQYKAAEENDEGIKSLPVNCVLDFVVKKGTKVYSHTEQENITLEVPLYSNALGSLDQAVKSKIDDTQNRIKELEDSANKWGMLNTIYGMWCTASEHMGVANNALQMGKSVYYAFSCMHETAWKAACGTAAGALPGCFMTVGKAECTSKICPEACEAAGSAGAAAGTAAGPEGTVVGGAVGCVSGIAACISTCTSAMTAASTAVAPSVAIITANSGAPTGSPELAVTSALAIGGLSLPAAPLASSCMVTDYPAMVATCKSWLATEVSWKKVCASTSKTHNIVDRFVWPTGVGSLYTEPVGTINKYGCMIFNKCALTDLDQYISVGVDLGGYAIGSKWINTKGSLGYTGGEGLSKAQATWLEAAKTNAIQSSGTGSWWADPFKNKDVAKYTACLPAWKYSLDKEKQINCIRKNCLEQHAKAGLPPDDCDLAFKERECMYVTGASLTGFESGVVESISRALLANLPNIILGISWKMLCGEYITASAECYVPGVCVDHYNVACALSGAGLTIAEVVDLIQRDFVLKKRELRGTDYCSTADSTGV